MTINPDIHTNKIWRRLIKLQGNLFLTFEGKPFTYEIEDESMIVIGYEKKGDLFQPVTEKKTRILNKSDFGRVSKIVPLDRPAQINKQLDPGVWGPSYIWAILHDVRVRK